MVKNSPFSGLKMVVLARYLPVLEVEILLDSLNRRDGCIADFGCDSD